MDKPEAVLDAALAGLGIAQVPSSLCAAELERGALRPVLPQRTPPTCFGTFITALTTPERLRVARKRSLLSHLQAGLATACTETDCDRVFCRR